MKTRFVKTILTKGLYLHRYNDKCLDPDYSIQEIWLNKGMECFVRIQKHEDGRTYYCYFLRGGEVAEERYGSGNEIFYNQCMTKVNLLYPNTGVITGQDIKEMDNYLKSINL